MKIHFYSILIITRTRKQQECIWNKKFIKIFLLQYFDKDDLDSTELNQLLSYIDGSIELVESLNFAPYERTYQINYYEPIENYIEDKIDEDHVAQRLQNMISLSLMELYK